MKVLLDPKEPRLARLGCVGIPFHFPAALLQSDQQESGQIIRVVLAKIEGLAYSLQQLQLKHVPFFSRLHLDPGTLLHRDGAFRRNQRERGKRFRKGCCVRSASSRILRNDRTAAAGESRS